MTQPTFDDLLDAPEVKLAKGAPITSRQAANRAIGGSGTQRRRIYEYIVRSGGATDEKIGRELGLSQNTVRPRRLELVERGFVCDSGRFGKVASGGQAIVWEMIP